MPISLEEALQISDLTVLGFGAGLVFVGLICIIIICSITGTLCKSLIKDKPDSKEKNVAPASVNKNDAIANKSEFVAAVSAVIAEELGTDVTGIRINKIKRI